MREINSRFAPGTKFLVSFFSENQFQLRLENLIERLLGGAGTLAGRAAEVLLGFMIDDDFVSAHLQRIQRAEQRLEAGRRQAELLRSYLECAQAIGSQKDAAGLAGTTWIVHHVRADDDTVRRVFLGRRSRKPCIRITAFFWKIRLDGLDVRHDDSQLFSIQPRPAPAARAETFVQHTALRVNFPQ